MPRCRYWNKAKLWQVSSYRCNLPCSLLYVHWKPDSICIIWSEAIIHTGLARLPVINTMGEPNTPLAFRRRDACHLEQQAGHGKIIAGIGQDTEDSISWIADYDNLYFTYSSSEEQIRTLTKLLFRGAVAFGAKTHQRYPSLSKREIITKLTKLFGKTLYSPMSCLLYMVLILSSLIFGLGLPCLYSNSLSEPS